MSSRPLVRLLRRARIRWVLDRAARWALAPSVAAAGLLGLAAFGCYRFAEPNGVGVCRELLGPVGLSEGAWCSLLSCFGAIWATAGVSAYVRQRGDAGLMRMARVLDSKLALADRLATAWWLTGTGRAPSFLERAAIADADRLASRVDVAQALPLRRLWTGMACALLWVGLALLPVAQQAPQQPAAMAPEKVPPPSASAGEDGRLDARLEAQPTPELTELADLLGQALRRGSRMDPTPSEVFQTLRRVGREAAHLSRGASATLQSRAQALAESSQSAEAAAALKRGELEAAVRAFDTLAERVGTMATSPSSELLSQALARAAQVGSAPAESTSTSAKELSHSLQQAARSVGVRSEDASDALADVAQSLRQRLRESEAAAELARRADVAQESLRQRGQASSDYADRLRRFSQRAHGGRPDAPGERGSSGDSGDRASGSGESSPRGSAGSSEGSRLGAAGTGLGAGRGQGTDMGTAPRKVRRSAQRRVAVDAKDTGQGAVQSQQVSADSVRGAARAGFALPSYGAAYRPYHRVAERALAGDTIPAGYAATVRRYFQLIQPRAPTP